MNLENRITKTLTLFALQSTALTLLELWKFLVRDVGELSSNLGGAGELVAVPQLENRTVSVARVLAALAQLVSVGVVVESYGYYTLESHAALLRQRWYGYGFGVWREKRIRRTIKGLRYLPFVRGVALAGSQALGLQKQESDIDLFIVTAPGWLWLPRTLVTVYFQILAMRRHGVSIANRFCLNHYIAGSKRMVVGRNWYTAIEYGKLRPLVGRYFVQAFQKNNEQWLTAFFPNLLCNNTKALRPPVAQTIVERLLNNPVGKSLERLLRALQRHRIHTEEAHVIVEDDELSFHPHSKQDAILSSYQ